MAVTNTVAYKDNQLLVTLKDASDTTTTGDIYWCSAANVAGLNLGCVSTDEAFMLREISWQPAGTTGQYVTWHNGSLTGPVIFRAFFGTTGTADQDPMFRTKTFDPPFRAKPVWDASENTFTTGGTFVFTIA